MGVHFLRHAQRESPLVLPKVLEQVVVQAGETLSKLKHRKHK